LIETATVQAGFIQCRFVVDSDIAGVTRNGKATRGCVVEFQIVSKNKRTQPKSRYAQKVADALRCWAEGEPRALDALGVALDGSKFRSAVVQALRDVEFGQTLSYKELAERSGYPRAHRAVASVCSNNVVPLIIPCHRVIKSDGSVGRYFYGEKLKAKLLAFEAR
jgi:O-6-methylguanine DNA methyltransferase